MTKTDTQGGGGKPEIWSWGHRNIQGAALDGQGRLWTIEHGPKGGDELNRPQAGRNYGWPLVSQGDHYDGTPITARFITQFITDHVHEAVVAPVDSKF